MNRIQNFLKGFLVIGSLFACISASAQDSFKPTASGSGLTYLKVTDVEGRTPKPTDIIKVNIIAYLNDSVVFDSKEQMKAPMELVMSAPAKLNDLMEGYQMMSKGDRYKFRVLSDILFAESEQKPPNVKNGDLITWDVEMVNVLTRKEKEAEEVELAQKNKELNSKMLEQFIATSKLPFITTKSGLKYVIREKGTGAQIQNGQKAVMNYTGRLLDGTIFDSNIDPKFKHVKPFEFVLGAGQVIKGWDEGIAKLKVGDEATLLIPANLAYGPQARPSIPANSVLIFEVKLLSIGKSEAEEIEGVLQDMD